MGISQTLSSSFVVEGIGLHSGQPVRVEVRPAVIPQGRVFYRDGVAIPALTDFVVDTRRCTTLGRDGQTVGTVEHLLAALMLAGIDHADIIVDGPELPALDGCAQRWSAEIAAAGVCRGEVEIPSINIVEPQWIVDGESQFFLLPADDLLLYAAVSIPDTIATQMLAGGALTRPEVREQLLRARTYGLASEVAALLEAGLALGGTLDNAVVLTNDGYLNPNVWPEEPAWHKVLDLLGDLALTGARLTGQILAVRGGHRSHVALAARLRQQCPACARHACPC
ncbi:MAG TPA: UDP-3-O-acyl-N-acetylglucosamine deacetylase [Armatimonadota bacterium]|jgi:UDP-3-O-[3-hydroxymyristoyl] N-acetylglucosamine deacetylase